ncbi:MAG: tRNA 4-thiouridine(8) synthase ThiI [Lachnospiraceae bacterium]|nr:tRNA 4-thiouridine(8) synthase ThiI [Lachnospiraceae bacterium]
MFQAFLIKYAEIAIKGKNRNIFEDALLKQIRRALKDIDGSFNVFKTRGRVHVEADGDFDYDGALEKLQKVFGITSICPVKVLEDEGFDKLTDEIISYVDEVYEDKNFSFKMHARRARKDYPIESMDMNARVGEKLLEKFPTLKVDVHDPDVMINVEIREQIFIYSIIYPGAGGMPIGTGGKAMVLLSGGIDSPVAAHMIAKRGVVLNAVYFHAPPYTSDRARQKVVDLASEVSEYAGTIWLHVVNFTEIQKYIYEKCPHEELTIIMRRYMMRIAELIAKKNDCQALVTGESIGQVASQTLSSLTVTNEVCTMPVFRPLIGFDKQEIVERAEKIGTFETSILPYEDCCTIWVAKHPVTHPDAKRIRRHELFLNDEIDRMVADAVDGRTIMKVDGDDVKTVGIEI